jgi:hypothetical protein
MYASRFTEAHQIYRKAVRDWCERVIVPNAEAFERDELTPREVFKQAGQLGFLGARFPEACGGSGGDFWYTVCWAEELARTGLAGTTMGLLVQSDMATPVIGEIGTQAQISAEHLFTGQERRLASQQYGRRREQVVGALHMRTLALMTMTGITAVLVVEGGAGCRSLRLHCACQRKTENDAV